MATNNQSSGPRPSLRSQFARRLLQQHEEQQRSFASVRSVKAAPTATKPADKLNIAIIGGGMAGLYAAMILDSLGVTNYKIMEATERLGGRIHTYYFSGKDRWRQTKDTEPAYYNYIDMGAMRFPKMDTMKRVTGEDVPWSLFNFLNGHLKNNQLPPIRLVDYILSTDNNPYYFNKNRELIPNFPSAGDKLAFGDKNQQGPGSAVPDDEAVKNYGDLLDAAFKPVKAAMENDFNEGFKQLLQYDKNSTRTYLREKLNYEEIVISYLETLDSGTGLYNMAFTESVMDSFDFDADEWSAVNGGTERFIDAMELVVRNGLAAPAGQNFCKDRVSLNCWVTEIAHTGDTLAVTHTTPHPWIHPHATDHFDHVICTAPLTAMRKMELGKLELSYKKLAAFRELHYDHSVKVAVSFKSRWWEDKDFMGGKPFVGGKGSTDLPLRVVVYPSYGDNLPNLPGVMIASYTWSQDASRMAAIPEVELKNLVLSNLAQIHGVPVNKLYDLYLSHKRWDWDDVPHIQGAFALYGPGQFSTLYPGLVQPEADKRFHMAGEACSVHHAWVIGSLNSAYRCVYEILDREGLETLKDDLLQKWHVVDEVEYGAFSLKVEQFLAEEAKAKEAIAPRVEPQGAVAVKAGARSFAKIKPRIGVSASHM